jgi:hypothetical protein
MLARFERNLLHDRFVAPLFASYDTDQPALRGISPVPQTPIHLPQPPPWGGVMDPGLPAIVFPNTLPKKPPPPKHPLYPHCVHDQMNMGTFATAVGEPIRDIIVVENSKKTVTVATNIGPRPVIEVPDHLVSEDSSILDALVD